MPYKHVSLTNIFTQNLPDDEGNLRPVSVEHKAVMDVPVADLDAFLIDARTRWVGVEVADTCPGDCSAQLATGS